MRRLNILISACLSLGLTAPLAAEAGSAGKVEVASAVESFAGDLRSNTDVPAFGIATISCGAIELQMDGLTRIDGDQRIGSGARFNIGSNAKSMLASAAARLQQNGKLTLDDTIAQALPELAKLYPDKAQITLAQLLSHSSGLPGFDTGSALGTVPEFDGTPAEIRAATAEWFLSQQLAGTPGGQTIYSNAGYVVAGYWLARVSGKTLPDVLQEEVFHPLGIEAGLGEPRQMSGTQPFGHYITEAGVTAYSESEPPIPPFLAAAGNVALTPLAYARYIQAHLCGLQGESDYLPSVLVERLHTPVIEGGSALGWGVTELGGATTSFHIGGTGDFTAYAAIAPDKDRAAFAMLSIGGAPASVAQKWLIEVISAPLEIDENGRSEP